MDLYRIIALLIGASAITFGISLNSLLATTILTSMGASSLMSGLLGGINKEDLVSIVSINSDELEIGGLKKIAANIRLSGPVATSVIVGSLVFGAGYLIRNQEAEQYNTIKKIVENVNFKNLETNESINGLIIDENSIYHQINLSYKTGFQQPYDSIETKQSLINNDRVQGIRWQEIFQQKDLAFDHRLNQPESVEFDIKDGNNTNISLGFLEPNEIINVLTNLAKKTSGQGGNNLTEKIFTDCVSVKGVCKMPDIKNVDISFAPNLAVDEAYVCPESEILLRFKLDSQAKIFLSESIGGFEEGLKITKVNPYNLPSPCLQGKSNWIQVHREHASKIFKNSAIGILTKGYATFYKDDNLI